MRVLVTGPRGFVGARIMDVLPDAIPAPSLRDADEASVKRMVETVRPDVIVHTAAISDVSACEADPEASWHANVLLPVWLAQTGVRLIAFSTDQVYGGCESEGPYREDMAVPANMYARHKLAMEERTLEASAQTVLLRATWMYDMPRYGVSNRGNFLMNMLLARSLAFSSSQHRAVTYVREVAGHIREAMALPGGVYNYGSENDATMMETARWLKRELSLSVELREAEKRHSLWMDGTKARDSGIVFRNTRDGLKQCIADYGLCV